MCVIFSSKGGSLSNSSSLLTCTRLGFSDHHEHMKIFAAASTADGLLHMAGIVTLDLWEGGGGLGTFVGEKGC